MGKKTENQQTRILPQELRLAIKNVGDVIMFFSIVYCEGRVIRFKKSIFFSELDFFFFLNTSNRQQANKKLLYLWLYCSWMCSVIAGSGKEITFVA